jgi:hypothetical protein
MSPDTQSASFPSRSSLQVRYRSISFLAPTLTCPSPNYHPHQKHFNMCTTFRVYYSCGHLKSSTTTEHSGFECTQTSAQRLIIDRECTRCIYRASQRDKRLHAIKQGCEPPVEEYNEYDGGDERSLRDSPVVADDDVGTAVLNDTNRTCGGMGCDCETCPWDNDTAKARRESARTESDGSLSFVEGLRLGEEAKEGCRYVELMSEKTVVDDRPGQ